MISKIFYCNNQVQFLSFVVDHKCLHPTTVPVPFIFTHESFVCKVKTKLQVYKIEININQGELEITAMQSQFP